MNIIETKTFTKDESNSEWSQERILKMSAMILTASNKLANELKVSARRLDVGKSLLEILRTSPIMLIQNEGDCVGLLNGVIRVYLDETLEDNSCIVSQDDTGIKLVFEGLI